MIIVTGSCGFIGSNLVKRLLEKGETVIGVDYNLRNYNPTCLHYDANSFYENLGQHCKNVKMIFHEGAISSTTETNSKKLFQYNINPSLELIYFCRDNNIPLQYASSASVYGNLLKYEWSTQPKQLKPLNQYANSKKDIDYVSNLVMDSIRPPILLQGMRYFNVYGPNEDHKGDQSSPHHKFRQQLLETGKIKLFEGSKEFYRDFISVEQVIDLKLNAINSMPSGIYDVGTGTPQSFYEVAAQICLENNINDPDNYIEWIPMPANIITHYQRYSCANIEWIKK